MKYHVVVEAARPESLAAVRSKVHIQDIARAWKPALAITSLLKIPDARFSIFGTSLFWGAGSTMRFLLVAWVPLALGITNNRMPAYLNAAVAVGIVVGAGLAASRLIGRSVPCPPASSLESRYVVWRGRPACRSPSR